MTELGKVDSFKELHKIWTQLSVAYNPPLNTKIQDFDGYIRKLSVKAINLACFEGDRIAGCVSFYANDSKEGTAFITQIATHPDFQGMGIAGMLLDKAKEISSHRGMRRMRLEVKRNNRSAQRFYLKRGFSFEGETPDSFFMTCKLSSFSAIGDES